MPLSASEVQILVFSQDKTGHSATTNMVVSTKNIPLPDPITLENDNWEFELKPMLDNRWGDFPWPPTPNLIGAEARNFRYTMQPISKEKEDDWTHPTYDISHWMQQQYGYGPEFWQLGPLTEYEATTELDAKILRAENVYAGRGFMAKWRNIYWNPYDFSWKHGLKNDAGHQGYHGLKEQIHDDIIAFGSIENHHRYTTRVAEKEGSIYYLRSSVVADADEEVWMRIGDYTPSYIWINSNPIPVTDKKVFLKKGQNTILLKYNGVGKGYIVFEKITGESPSGTPSDNVKLLDPSIPAPMESLWYQKNTLLPYDCMSQPTIGRYRFTAPAGLRKISLTAIGTPQIWVNAKPIETKPTEENSFKVELENAIAEESTVAIQIKHIAGIYGGNAIPEPIRLECGKGIYSLGDWSRQEVLLNYSGGAWYRKTITLPQWDPASKPLLDLGQLVSSTEVWCNKKQVGIRVAPPYQFDLSATAHPGENSIEVLIYNTAANHWSTIPTRYKGKLDSGLMGPVVIRFAPK